MYESSLLREARQEDLPQLQAIRAAAFLPVFLLEIRRVSSRIDRCALASADAEQAALLDELTDSGWNYRIIVAERRRCLAGFTSYRTDPGTREGRIGLTAVDPAFQRRGVGRALIDSALALMRESGMRAALMGVGGDPSVEPAHRLLASAGFRTSVPSRALYRAL